MKNEVYCSTGAFVGRMTGYDHSVIKTEFPAVCRETGISGMEYIFMTSSYSIISDVRKIISDSKIPCKVLHADKNIGTLLSEGGEENRAEALRLWKINCEECRNLGAQRAVLHLWGSERSDNNFAEDHLSAMPYIKETADRFGVSLMIENVPCAAKDPLSRMRELADFGTDFVFDVRFGQLHRQNFETVSSEFMKNGRISHVHISDTKCGYREFSGLRPILHPGEGDVDFEMIFSELKKADYRGTFTLESPVISESGIDWRKLSESLNLLTQKVRDLDLT